MLVGGVEDPVQPQHPPPPRPGRFHEVRPPGCSSARPSYSCATASQRSRISAGVAERGSTAKVPARTAARSAGSSAARPSTLAWLPPRASRSNSPARNSSVEPGGHARGSGAGPPPRPAPASDARRRPANPPKLSLAHLLLGHLLPGLQAAHVEAVDGGQAPVGHHGAVPAEVGQHRLERPQVGGGVHHRPVPHRGGQADVLLQAGGGADEEAPRPGPDRRRPVRPWPPPGPGPGGCPGPPPRPIPPAGLPQGLGQGLEPGG